MIFEGLLAYSMFMYTEVSDKDAL